MRSVKVLLTVLVSFLIATLSASAAAQTNVTVGNLPLWKTKGKSNTVHILGSIHFLKADFYPLPAPIENAFTNAEIVVFETEMDRMKDPVTMRKIMAEGTYPVGKTIAENVSKETYKLLQKTLTEKIGQPAALDRFKPYLIAITLGAIELQRLGFRSEDGIDHYILAKAKAAKKEVRALETVEKQMSFFTGMTKAQQEAFLKSTLTDLSQVEEMMDEIVAAWKTGDSAKLDALIMDSMKDHPDLVQRLLTDRNKNWVPEIEKLLQGNSDAFVVVGAAHLAGKDNLIDLLKAKGIAVQQVSAP